MSFLLAESDPPLVESILADFLRSCFFPPPLDSRDFLVSLFFYALSTIEFRY